MTTDSLAQRVSQAITLLQRAVALADTGDQESAEAALRQAPVLEPEHVLACSNPAALLSTRLMRLQYQPVADERLLTDFAKD